jgi:hypothetical protein
MRQLSCETTSLIESVQGERVEDKRFDDLSRSVAAMSSRRSVLRGIIGGAVASLIGTISLRGSASARNRPSGAVCRKDRDCAEGLACIGPDATGRSRCCGGSSTACGTTCFKTYCDPDAGCQDGNVHPACYDWCVANYCYGTNQNFNYNFNYSFNNQPSCEAFCAYEMCPLGNVG